MQSLIPNTQCNMKPTKRARVCYILLVVSHDHLRFSVNGRFCYDAALLRIRQRGPNLEAMRTQAKAEQLLMSFYDCTLPPISLPSAEGVVRHQPSVDLLEVNSPWMLNKYEPLSVAGDGNCLFRAVSYALFSTEKHYMQLRLLSTIEVLLNGDFYDIASSAFYIIFHLILQSRITHNHADNRASDRGGRGGPRGAGKTSDRLLRLWRRVGL